MKDMKEMKNEVNGGAAAEVAAETVADNATAEVAAETVAPEREEGAEIVTELKIERRSFVLGEGSDRKDCFAYYIKALFESNGRAKEVVIDLSPVDVGGYEVIDLMHDLFGGCELHLVPWSIKAEKKGEKDSHGVTLVLCAKDAPAELRMKVKASKESDKALLNAYLKFLGYIEK